MSTATAELIEVEVAYARPDQQEVLVVRCLPGVTIEQVIRQSDILQRFPEIDLALNKVGIFGRLCALDAPVRAGDRVEIYRALIADPKEVRRQRAARGRPARRDHLDEAGIAED